MIRERCDVIDRGRRFVMVPYEVIDAVDDPRALALYVVLRRYAGSQGRAHPSRGQLAADLGYKSARSIDPILRVLVDIRVVRIFPRWRDADGHVAFEPDDRFVTPTSNGYEVYDMPGDAPPDAPSGDGGGDPGPGEPVAAMPTPAPEPAPAAPEPSAPARSRAAGFAEFWDVYPRRVGKRAAEKAWENAVQRAAPATILAGARRYATDPNLPPAQYRPHPSTWLNQDRWEDEPLPPREDAGRGRPARPEPAAGTRPEDWLPPPAPRFTAIADRIDPQAELLPADWAHPTGDRA